jgi:hypothetical protein
MSSAEPRNRKAFLTETFVVLTATVIAVVGAQPLAGSWNDGGRLAAVESLVDRHTFVIDDSIFVAVPQRNDPLGRRAPYDTTIADAHNLIRTGTMDKLLIRGHFYSDKSPVPTLLLALFYWILQALTGLRAAYQPEVFCYAMALLSSGVPYVVAVWAVFRLGRVMRLPWDTQLLLTVSFALATLAPVYARSVNGHMVQLAAVAPLMVGLAKLADPESRRPQWLLLTTIGSLTGFAYAADLGAGPPLLVCTLALVAWRTRSALEVGVFLLAAMPWLIVHHGVSYWIGGTFRPIGSVEEYLTWPGSFFTRENMTGTLKRRSIIEFVSYATGLLFGNRGFVGHNLPMYLAILALVLLLSTRSRELPELWFSACWCAGTWLMYSLMSNNYSGQCCSIRWFLPLLAPGYYVLAVALRRFPAGGLDLLILSGLGMALVGIAWQLGPWTPYFVPGYWWFQCLAVGWLALRGWWWGKALRGAQAQG